MYKFGFELVKTGLFGLGFAEGLVAIAANSSSYMLFKLRTFSPNSGAKFAYSYVRSYSPITLHARDNNGVLFPPKLDGKLITLKGNGQTRFTRCPARLNVSILQSCGARVCEYSQLLQADLINHMGDFDITFQLKRVPVELPWWYPIGYRFGRWGGEPTTGRQIVNWLTGV